MTNVHVSNVDFKNLNIFNQKEIKQGCILENLYLAPAPLVHIYLSFPFVLTLRNKFNFYINTLYSLYLELP